MRPVQDEADDVGLDLKQAAPSQISRVSRSAVTPSCSAPSADSSQETDGPCNPVEGPLNAVPADDSDEWDYDPFTDPGADSEPDEGPVDLPPSIQPRRHIAAAIPPPETISLRQRLTRWTLVLAVIALVPFLLRSLVQIYEIPSGSMESTLRDGDKVVVTMFDSDDIDRGDVVVFTDPDDWLHVKDPTGLRGVCQKIMVFAHVLPDHTGHHLVKRVIGVGGDHVVSDGKGTLSVNGVSVNEPYVKDGQSPSLTSFDVTVPQGYVWVMGDNRSNSADSRYHRDDAHGGFVPLKDVVGVAKMVFQWTNPSRWASLGGGEQAFSQVPDHDTSVPSPAPTRSRPTASSSAGPTQLGTDSDAPDDEAGTSPDDQQTGAGEASEGSENTGPGRIASDPGPVGEDSEPEVSGSAGTGRSDMDASGADATSSSGGSDASGADVGATR